MNEQPEIIATDAQAPREDGSSAPAQAHDESGADEFQLTIRKLDMPVRPRGVLAE
jgi:hypothetical protein